MDADYRTKLDAIIHHTAEAEVAINAEKWDEAGWAIAYAYEAAYDLQKALPHPDPGANGLL